MAMTPEERQAFYDEYGTYPIEESDIPEADRLPLLTEDQLAEVAAVQARGDALKYLADTDWYATRKAETGTEIPDDVLALRAQARVDASDD